MLNLRNWHHYAPQNAFVRRNSSLQRQISLGIWLGVVDDCLISPYVFCGHLTSMTYFEFLEHHLPGLLDAIPVFQRSEIIVQYHGTLYILKILFDISWLSSILDRMVIRFQFLGRLDRKVYWNKCWTSKWSSNSPSQTFKLYYV